MKKLKYDDLVIPQGTTWAVQWPLRDPDGLILNTAGWSVRAQVRRNIHDSTVLYEWSTALNNASVVNSVVELKVTPAVSSAWNWGTRPVVYDVEVTTSTGDVIRVTQGNISLSGEVTR